MTKSFEGWYFKQQSDHHMIAFIPAVHTDKRGRRLGSVQVVTPKSSYFIELPVNTFHIDRKNFIIRAGDSTFSAGGIDVCIRNPGLNVDGRLSYGKIKPPCGDIMGPYSFIPMMECRHSVFSLTHTVSGSLTVNGSVLSFTDGAGYLEGDKGRSFPKRYVWTQCSWAEKGPCALMLSAAEVKPLGREFIGIIGFVYFKGREFRIATYKGARVMEIGGGTVVVRQGDFSLSAQRLDNGGHTLRAPQSGDMKRLIKESLSCKARYVFTEKNNVLFDLTTDYASFEYEF